MFNEKSVMRQRFRNGKYENEKKKDKKQQK